jgi:hypothetical protein
LRTDRLKARGTTALALLTNEALDRPDAFQTSAWRATCTAIPSINCHIRADLIAALLPLRALDATPATVFVAAADIDALAAAKHHRRGIVSGVIRHRTIAFVHRKRKAFS